MGKSPVSLLCVHHHCPMRQALGDSSSQPPCSGTLCIPYKHPTFHQMDIREAQTVAPSAGSPTAPKVQAAIISHLDSAEPLAWSFLLLPFLSQHHLQHKCQGDPLNQSTLPSYSYSPSPPRSILPRIKAQSAQRSTKPSGICSLSTSPRAPCAPATQPCRRPLALYTECSLQTARASAPKGTGLCYQGCLLCLP